MVLLLLLVTAVAEIAVFIQVGARLGVGLTLLLVFASAVFGFWLVRAQGFAAATRVQAMITRGESPALELLEGLALLAAGILLVIPGFVTDIVAFALLIPPLRRGILRFYLRRVRPEGTVTSHYPGPDPGPAKPGRPPLEGESRRED
jgi:UPF0716 protein FxsA